MYRTVKAIGPSKWPEVLVGYDNNAMDTLTVIMRKIKSPVPDTMVIPVLRNLEHSARPLFRQLGLGFVLPVAVLIALDLLLVLPLVRSEVLTVIPGIALVLVPKLFVLPVVSALMMRITERHYHRYGHAGVKNILLGSLLATVLLLLVTAVESVQTIIFDTRQQLQASNEPGPEYQFRFDPVAGIYEIRGEIDFGITRDFRQFLLANPGGTRLVLESPGGSIYEGRGLLKIVSANHLDTHVEAECSSACVLAFLGGDRRTLGVGARLGFHQYILDMANLNQALPFYDPVREQQYDIDLMRKIGISEDFLRQAFSIPHKDIWYPDKVDLKAAGVIQSAG
ncbi:MAG: hypothetical protein WBM41_12830 [Arenicellales bacterium]